jgi:hypothetical protein
MTWFGAGSGSRRAKERLSSPGPRIRYALIESLETIPERFPAVD